MPHAQSPSPREVCQPLEPLGTPASVTTTSVAPVVPGCIAEDSVSPMPDEEPCIPSCIANEGANPVHEQDSTGGLNPAAEQDSANADNETRNPLAEQDSGNVGTDPAEQGSVGNNVANEDCTDQSADVAVVEVPADQLALLERALHDHLTAVAFPKEVVRIGEHQNIYLFGGDTRAMVSLTAEGCLVASMDGQNFEPMASFIAFCNATPQVLASTGFAEAPSTGDDVAFQPSDSALQCLGNFMESLGTEAANALDSRAGEDEGATTEPALQSLGALFSALNASEHVDVPLFEIVPRDPVFASQETWAANRNDLVTNPIAALEEVDEKEPEVLNEEELV
eukprot:gnl/TRDRNA2_/TRDRNA2_140760_c3_seq1.p1 gnl/TRDRNA2_/TRDRNA2_140760_c3~~gnl/TRDRNA2_/TRDRNA2_140760_c3_seq1.p1  ORF type:complete len:389 (-),score=64.83 gnl/TRDRNA2_/TRDRNA2_140760_c3_seq1:176-1189(-)